MVVGEKAVDKMSKPQWMKKNRNRSGRQLALLQ
jgi:hypothetical protein